MKEIWSRQKNSIIVRTGINSLRQHLSPTTGPRVVSTVLANTEVVESRMRKKKREKSGTIFQILGGLLLCGCTKPDGEWGVVVI